MTDTEPNEWRETVRDLYDKLHFGPDNIFTGNRLAMGVVTFIEERHPGFFTPLTEGPRSPHR
jgi:hypothetical protein